MGVTLMDSLILLSWGQCQLRRGHQRQHRCNSWLQLYFSVNFQVLVAGRLLLTSSKTEQVRQSADTVTACEGTRDVSPAGIEAHASCHQRHSRAVWHQLFQRVRMGRRLPMLSKFKRRRSQLHLTQSTSGSPQTPRRNKCWMRPGHKP